MKAYSFDIDVVSACNLRCPSCAQGNVTGYRIPPVHIDPQLLRQIIAKARSECTVTRVQLFVWGEPLLHPHLPELIRIVQEAGIPCHVSSNLNLLPDADSIMAVNPASFKVSLSGFTPETYGYTHRGGDIERVKSNLAELSAAKRRQRASTRIYVTFHRYRHNLRDEPPLRSFLAGLGIDCETIWAQLLPLEKVLRYVDAQAFDFPLTSEDHQLIAHLALPLGPALALARQHKEAPCPLRDRQYSIDALGNARLCCAGFDPRQFTIGAFLDMPLSRIQALREKHPICGQCMAHGAHVYMTGGVPALDDLALANLADEDVALLDLRYELAVQRMKRRLDSFYRCLPVTLSPVMEAALTSRVNRVQQLVARSRHLFGARRRSPE